MLGLGYSDYFLVVSFKKELEILYSNVPNLITSH